MSTNVRPNNVIEVTAADLPLHCPTEGVALWSNHPRVFLPLENGQARCPYCGTLYKFVGEMPAGH
ncbi:MAG: zinc-finger domain-containing protein [Neisseriaceae bacterium]|nr:zinc-finger domain-containing protein [Neisseriaceae bacterium]MBP6860982.1 zinc-finger domain-containing protein [Neisseriaceae bacterium]